MSNIAIKIPVCEYKNNYYNCNGCQSYIDSPVTAWLSLVGYVIINKLFSRSFLKKLNEQIVEEVPKDPRPIKIDITIKNRQDNAYKIRKSNKIGNCIIINTKKSPEGNRDGTEIDVQNLKECWSARGFKVSTFNDLKASKIIKIIKKYSQKVDIDHDAFIVCILSHGSEKGISGTDNEYITIEEIKNAIFHNKKVKNRSIPKFLVLQACRGQRSLSPIKKIKHIQHDYPNKKLIKRQFSQTNEKVPHMRDLLILYPTCDGHIALRHKDKGTPLITSLCKNIVKYGNTLDLNEILTLVKKEVGKWTEIQAPETLSSYTKSFFLPKSTKQANIVDKWSKISEDRQIVKTSNYGTISSSNLKNLYLETFNKLNEFINSGGKIEHIEILCKYLNQCPR